MNMCVSLTVYVPGFWPLLIVTSKPEYQTAIRFCLACLLAPALTAVPFLFVVSVINIFQLSICVISIYSQSRTLTIDL